MQPGFKITSYFRQCVGVDVAKSTFMACLSMLDDMGCSTPSFEFDNDKHGFNQFVKWVRKEMLKEYPICFVMEPTGETGAYWDSMIAEKRCHSDILHQNGMADYQRFAVLKIAVMPQKPEHSGTNAVSRGMPHQKPEHTGTVDRR